MDLNVSRTWYGICHVRACLLGSRVQSYQLNFVIEMDRINRWSQILKPYMSGASGNFQEQEEGLYLGK